MTVRQVFASNLARLCRQRPSIQAVCREAGINRQQFGRYLAGTAIPRGQTIERICKVFGVEEEDLFRQEIRADVAKEPNDLAFTERFYDIVQGISREAPANVAPGIYFADFAYEESQLVRSTVVVRRSGGLTTFRRLTGVTERKESWWSHFSGDHWGVVLQRQYAIYFVALDQMVTRAPSMLVVNWIPNILPMLGGHACVLTPIGPTVTAVVVSQAARRLGLRGALRSSHVYSTEGPEIDAVIIDALAEQCRLLQGMVRPLDVTIRPARSLAQ